MCTFNIHRQQGAFQSQSLVDVCASRASARSDKQIDRECAWNLQEVIGAAQGIRSWMSYIYGWGCKWYLVIYLAGLCLHGVLSYLCYLRNVFTSTVYTSHAEPLAACSPTYVCLA